MGEPSATQAIDWESRYRDGATGWERPGLNPAFVAWRTSGALGPCRVLVPGSGRSPEPLALAEAGFDVTLVDSAPAATAAQRARLDRLHVRAQVVQADLLSWSPEAPFEAIYDQGCLCALRPHVWSRYVARLHQWLSPGGRLFILFMQSTRGGGPPFHCSLEEMHQLFAAPHWVWPETLISTVAHSAGLSEQPAILQRI